MSVGPGLGISYGYCVRPPGPEKTGCASHDAPEPPKPGKWALQDLVRRLRPYDRVAACHRVLADYNKGVTVRRDATRAWYEGVVACGSVWTCPVCARKIGEKRREELQAAIDHAIGQGGDVALITFTFSHGIHHRLKDLSPKVSDAMRKVKSGRAWQKIKEKYGIIGSVRALEVTHGRNGWHPHVHEIEFFNRPLYPEERAQLKAEVFELWQAACRKTGLGLPDEQHGVDVRGASRAAEYVGKWGFASEVTRPASKSGWSGRTPWQMLEDYAAGDAVAGELFCEFADAFKGRRQLFWSRGLRDHLELGELFADEELAAMEPEPDPGDKAVDVVVIDSTLWSQICRIGARGRLLRLVMEAEHPEEIHGWLDKIREKVPIMVWRDDYNVSAKMQKVMGAYVSPFEQAEWANFNQQQCVR